MRSTANPALAVRRLIPPGAGEPWWLLGCLATIKVGPDATRGAMTITEVELPPGRAVARHSHRDEDEMSYVLNGEVTFTCHGEERTFTRGGMTWFPRRVPHAVAVAETGPARLLTIHTGPALAGLLAEIGTAADGPRMPDPPLGKLDLDVVAAACARNGIDIG